MTMPHSPRFEELLPAFALGALDEDELRELREHLAADCPICGAELRRLAADLEALAASAEPVAAALPSDLAERVLALAVAEPRAGSPPSQPLHMPSAALAGRRPGHPGHPRHPTTVLVRWSWLAAAALLLVAAWAVIGQARLGSEIERLRGQRDQLGAAVERLRGQRDQLAQRADGLARRVAQVRAESERLARTLPAVGVQEVQLAGMGASRSAVGRTWVNAADRKAVFYAFDLPALGPDKSYQLWFIDDGDRKTSAGVFSVDPQGQGSVVVDRLIPVERIQAWVVTVEPHGGRPQPTGPIALAG
jgi:hypothetical protein